MKRCITILTAALACCVLAGAHDLGLTLAKCRELAAANDPSIKNSALDAASARAQKEEALWAYLPTVSANVMAFHATNPLIDIGVTDILGKSDAAWNISNLVEDFTLQNGLPSRYTALQYGYGASVSLMQPLYAGGRIAAGNRLAELGIRAADLKAGLQKRETSDKVEEKYWLVVSLIEKEKVLASAMELLDSLAKDVDSAFGAGIATESDLLQVSLRRSELKSASAQLKGGMRLAKMDLFNCIGIRYSALSAASSPETPCIDDFIFDTGTGTLEAPDRFWVSEEALAAAMEETRLLDLQVEARKLEKRMELGAVLPQVALGGMYGYGHYIGDGKCSGAVFAMVTIPISDWGKTSRRLQRYGNEVAKAENDRDYLSSQLILKARQMWINLTTAWDQLSVAEEAVALAKDSYGRQKASFDAGLVTTSELLRAQTEMQQCEESYSGACMAYRSALDAYLELAGRHE